MADSIVKLRVDSKDYDQKIDSARRGLLAMEQACRKVGGTFEVVEKEELDFVKALGKMESQAGTTKGKLREMTNSINDLTTMYKGLTDAERNSPFGRALTASIDQLKGRAATLKDQMDDLNEELKHMASDTAFTDGVNLMSRTIGSCASAVVAFTGDNRELEGVIKDLAKIQGTIAAVEALTKAFQKQNMVLLKNPYVLAAAAIAAIGFAIYEMCGKADEATESLDKLKADMDKVTNAGNEEIIKLDLLNERMRDTNLAYDERKKALEKIQSIVPDYHGSLTTEGNLINDNADALDRYKDNLIKAATAQAAFKKLTENAEKRIDLGMQLKQAQIQGATNGFGGMNAQDWINRVGGMFFGNAGSLFASYRNDINGKLIDNNANNLKKQLSDLDNSDAYIKGLIDTDAIKTGGGGGGKTTTTKTYSSRGVNLPEFNPLAYGKPNFAQLEPTFDESKLAEMSQAITDGMPAVIVDVEFDQAGMAMRYDSMMEDAAANAKTTASAWSAASQAISNAGSAMQNLEDPSAKVAGIVMQAIANVALGFAQASASKATGAAGVFGWIAAATAGVATMTATIAQIKSATKGYAEGGWVTGSSHVGDAIPAFLNAGEFVMTANDVAQANANYENAYAGRANSKPYLTGQIMYLGINNFLKGAGLGQLVTTKG